MNLMFWLRSARDKKKHKTFLLLINYLIAKETHFYTMLTQDCLIWNVTKKCKINHGNVIFFGIIALLCLGCFFFAQEFYVFINTCLVTTNNYTYLDFCQLKVINHESKPCRKIIIGTHIKISTHVCGSFHQVVARFVMVSIVTCPSIKAPSIILDYDS